MTLEVILYFMENVCLHNVDIRRKKMTSIKKGRKHPLDTPKKMIERRERENEIERER